MSTILREHISKFASITDADYSAIMQYFEAIKIRKKVNLLIEGQVCRFNWFVEKGILRKFFITEKGTEQTTDFAIENWWATDIFSLEENKPSSFYIQAVEPSELLAISKENLELLLTHFPVMEKYFRCIYPKAYAAAQMRIRFLYEFSREELYHHFRNTHPLFLQRIPQYLIASYLGFTPEYLSEIRKKYIS